eukprot:8964535-Alexandrium_andersonii.AAC.1
MSASLVGSEMCIRDRPAGIPLCGFGARRGAPAEKGHGPIRLPRAAAQAVSYTHLTLPTICSV